VSQKIVRTFQIARNETVEIRWTDPKTGQVLIERYEAPPAATWQARQQRVLQENAAETLKRDKADA